MPTHATPPTGPQDPDRDEGRAGWMRGARRESRGEAFFWGGLSLSAQKAGTQGWGAESARGKERGGPRVGRRPGAVVGEPREGQGPVPTRGVGRAGVPGTHLHVPHGATAADARDCTNLGGRGSGWGSGHGPAWIGGRAWGAGGAERAGALGASGRCSLGWLGSARFSVRLGSARLRGRCCELRRNERGSPPLLPPVGHARFNPPAATPAGVEPSSGPGPGVGVQRAELSSSPSPPKHSHPFHPCLVSQMSESPALSSSSLCSFWWSMGGPGKYLAPVSTSYSTLGIGCPLQKGTPIVFPIKSGYSAFLVSRSYGEKKQKTRLLLL